MTTPADSKGQLDCSTLTGDSEAAATAERDLVPALTVLYHREPRRIGERALLLPIQAGREIALSRVAPLFVKVGAREEFGQPLADPRLSRQPVRILPADGGGVRIVSDGPQARCRYRDKPVNGAREISAAELREGGVLELHGAVALVLHLSQPLDGTQREPATLLGDSHRMHALRADLKRFAAIDAPLLIRGESGTGKELAAQALHALSARAGRPFIAVNLGAIPPSLAVAELFGAERGAFTGAAARQSGYFQHARGGTLFLDELGAAPPEVQAALLRAIETGEVRPLGAGAAEKVQTRLIAATDADLDSMIREQTFRLPLLHRLSTCELRLPALRERREDIGQLVLHFLRAECAAQGRPCLLDAKDAETAPWLPLRLLVRLASHDWPGNVRQLRNVVRQMVALDSGRLSLELPPSLQDESTAAAPSAPAPPSVSVKRSAPATPRRRPAEISQDELRAALEQSHWDLTAAAAALEIARPSLYMLLDKSPHLRTARQLTPEEIARSHRDCAGDLDAMAAQLHISRSALRRRLREMNLT